MRSQLNTVNITVLTLVLFLVIACAGTTLTEEEEYELHEAYIQIVIEYDNKVRDCHRSGDVLVTTVPRTRQIRGKLSMVQMSSARCVSSFEHDLR